MVSVMTYLPVTLLLAILTAHPMTGFRSMLHLPSLALSILVTNTAIFILGDTAVVMGVPVGDGGVATDAGGVFVGTNVSTHVMITRIFIGTLHVVVADDPILSIGGVGGTIFGTFVVTRL